MLTSIRRNNMALPTGSHSEDSMFDFFEDMADTTANTVEPVVTDGPEAMSSRQPVNTETLPKMYMGTLDPTKASGRELTDTSFQSIEEVIELAGDNNGMSEVEQIDRNKGTSKVKRVGGDSGTSKVEPVGGKIGTPEVHSRKFQLHELKNVALEQESDSQQNGRMSVISLLSNISLSENKPNEETASTHKLHIGESGSNIAPNSEMNRVIHEEKADTTELLQTDVDTRGNSTQNQTPSIEKEISFSLLKTETSYHNSHQKSPVNKSPSASNMQDTKEGDFYFLNKKRSKAPDQTETDNRGLTSGSRDGNVDGAAISPIPSVGPDLSWLTTDIDVKTANSGTNIASRPYSKKDRDLSWLTGDKDAQKSKSVTVFRSEAQKDVDFSWLKSNRDAKESEAELDSSKQTPSRAESKETVNVSWLTSDKEVKNESALGIISTSANPKKDMDLSWLRSEKDTVKTESIPGISQTSSQSATPILPTTEATTKQKLGWLNEKEKERTSALLHLNDRSPGMSPTENMSTSKEPNTNRRRDNDTQSQSDNEDILNKDQPSSGNRGEPEKNRLIQIKDLNFDFMAEETTEDNVPDPVRTRGATAFSLTSQSLSSIADILTVGDNNVEGGTKQSLSSIHQAVDDNNVEGGTKQSQSNRRLTPSQNKGTSPVEVSEAIHSAVTLFHNEKGASDVGAVKPTGKQKKKSTRQNSQQTNIRKKATKIDKPATGVIAGSDIKNKIAKGQNTRNVEIGKSKKSYKEQSEVQVNSESCVKGKQKKTKPHKETETGGNRSKNDNGNSSESVGYQQPTESSGSSEGHTSTMASSDTIIKIDDMSNYSLAYEDDFEEDTRSVKSTSSSKTGFDLDSQTKGKQSLVYSNSQYGGIYSAYARQPKQPIRNDNVKFPKLNALNPVQLTSGQSSFSEQSFSAVVKRKRKSKRKENFMDDSYEYKASSESDSKPEIILHKNGRVPVSLKAEAVYRNGRLEIAVVDDRQALSEGANMDVRITVVHKHLNGLQFVRNRPRKLPKLNFATNRDVVNHRAAYPPFNTHTDQQASERFKKTFGT